MSEPEVKRSVSEMDSIRERRKMEHILMLRHIHSPRDHGESRSYVTTALPWHACPLHNRAREASRRACGWRASLLCSEACMPLWGAAVSGGARRFAQLWWDPPPFSQVCLLLVDRTGARLPRAIADALAVGAVRKCRGLL